MLARPRLLLGRDDTPRPQKMTNEKNSPSPIFSRHELALLPERSAVCAPKAASPRGPRHIAAPAALLRRPGGYSILPGSAPAALERFGRNCLTLVSTRSRTNPRRFSAWRTASAPAIWDKSSRAF